MLLSAGTYEILETKFCIKEWKIIVHEKGARIYMYMYTGICKTE